MADSWQFSPARRCEYVKQPKIGGPGGKGRIPLLRRVPLLYPEEIT